MTCCPAFTGVRMTLSPTTTLSPLERSCKENVLQCHNLCRAVWPCRRGTCRTSFPHFQMGQDSPEYNITLNLYWPRVPPWPAFKRPTRMAFFSSKAGRRLLTVKYLGTIYPCDTRKMLGIIRWCCKNTHNALNYGSLLTCLIWCGGAELHCHIVSHCPVPWRKIKKVTLDKASFSKPPCCFQRHSASSPLLLRAVKKVW